MVNLRSGKRTNRLSTGKQELASESKTAEESTPKRPTRARKAKVFEEVESQDSKTTPAAVKEPSPVKNVLLSPKKAVNPTLDEDLEVISAATPERVKSPDIFADSDPDEVVSDSEEKKLEADDNNVEMTEKAVDAAAEEKSDDEEDDDDMPVEVSSKKNASKPEDDEPMEVSTKVVPEEQPQNSVVDKLLKRKADKAAKLAAKKMKKRSKKKESKKIQEGFYEVKMKKSSAKFNVVTLKSGVSKILEPEVNFREQLLTSRTSGVRVADSKKFQHRAEWVAKRF